MSATEKYAKQLGADLTDILGGSFKYKRSRLQLSRSVAEGYDVVILSVTGKYSPYVNVSFYFGKNYTRAKEIEQSIGDYQFPYHVQQYSLARQPLFASTYSGPDNWDVNLQEPPQNLPLELADAIRGMAEPFFDQFQSIEAARDAIASGSPDCLSGNMFWRQLLLLDASLGELDHFRSWMSCLDDWTRNQAENELVTVDQAINRVA